MHLRAYNKPEQIDIQLWYIPIFFVLKTEREKR